MKHIRLILMSLSIGLLLFSCQEEYIPDTTISQQEYVVEGYVEVGEGSRPTFLILTKSIPFISTIKPNQFAELFVRGAEVVVNDGTKDTRLAEICLEQIPDELKEEVYALLGLNPDSTIADICVYADIFSSITKEYGRKYDLTVKIGDKVLTSTTTVPPFTGLDNFVWSEPPGKPRDTLAELKVTIDDPANIKNYYRYFTATSRDRQLIPPFNSAINDGIFDGKRFEFPLAKAQRRGGDFDPENFGLYYRGDSVFVKWCCVDEFHFDFWRTRDSAANRGGPFASYTRISTNINGGLGIWGGYAVKTYATLVPPK